MRHKQNKNEQNEVKNEERLQGNLCTSKIKVGSKRFAYGREAEETAPNRHGALEHCRFVRFRR